MHFSKYQRIGWLSELFTQKLKQHPILKYGLDKNNTRDKCLKTGFTKQLFI